MWWLAGCDGAEAPTKDGEPPLHSSTPPAAHSSDTGAPPPPHSGGHTAEPLPRSFVVFVVDDIGTDEFALYGEHPDQPVLPTIEGLAAEGLLFRNAYGSPSCSPTRAALYTGTHARRNGIGRWIDPQTDTYSLPPMDSLATMARGAPSPLSPAFVGKWHLVTFAHPAPQDHPAELGFDDFVGTFGNLGNPLSGAHGANYSRWERVDHGVVGSSSTYATTGVVDDALAVLSRPEPPSMLVVAVHAAHVPIHVPPASLVTTPVDETSEDWRLQRAMAEALDHELGRLLDRMDPARKERTTFLLLGDNGTDMDYMRPPFDPLRRKGTLFDGGVRVPMLAWGAGVTARGSTDALVHVVDVMPTLAELWGTTPPAGAIDGVSFAPALTDAAWPGARGLVYSEDFYPNGDGVHWADERMVRDATHKLIRDVIRGEESLYRYVPGALDEGPDLLAEGTATADDLLAADRLRAAMDAHEAAFEAGTAPPLR